MGSLSDEFETCLTDDSIAEFGMDPMFLVADSSCIELPEPTFNDFPVGTAATAEEVETDMVLLVSAIIFPLVIKMIFPTPPDRRMIS